MAAKSGHLSLNQQSIFSVASDPAASAGTVGKIGSFATVTDGSGFYLKTGSAATAWTQFSIGVGTLNAVTYFSATSTIAAIPLNSSGTNQYLRQVSSGTPTFAQVAFTDLSFATQTANTVFAGPTTGTAATPAFRALVAADINSVAFVQNGNAFAAAAVLGTTDSNTLSFLTGNTSRFVVAAASSTLSAPDPASGAGTSATIRAGNAVAATQNGGSLTLSAGSATGSATGGDITVNGGTSSTGTAGSVVLKSGIVEGARINSIGQFQFSSANTLTSTNTISVASTPYTIGTSDLYLNVDTSAARTINLPAPSARRIIHIKDTSGSANTNAITLVRNASENIEGIASSRLLQTNWGQWTIVSDGTNWFLYS